MNLFLLIVMLFALYLFGLCYSYFKSDKDIFSPGILITFLQIISTIPYLLLLFFDQNQISYLIYTNDLDVENKLIWYLILQILGYICLIAGLDYKGYSHFFRNDPIMDIPKNRIHIAISVALSLGILGYMLFLKNVGGFSNLIYNLQHRAEFTSGNGYILTLLKFLTVAICLLIYSRKYKKIGNVRYKLFVCVVLVGTIFILSTLGGRKATIHLVIFCILFFHYGVSRVKKIPVKLYFLIILGLIYFIAMPILRSPGAVEYYSERPTEIYEEVKQNYTDAIKSISYVDHFVLITDHFNLQNIWLGKSYVDLLKAPMPRSVYPEKPPVDDGMYIRTIAEGYHVTPSKPIQELYASSWPPETFGSMYANFWIPGIVLGMYILGVIYKISYLFMRIKGYNFLSIFIYGSIILNFQLSNLRMVQVTTDILLIIIFFLLFSQKKLLR
ncbi:oligosaccharide repeat unit polymerase [Bacillus toyonensis]|uniref:oligosaccharide repeat unit polymerase n=1 Tax=Bacillus toyonensis TaxID=155322 RepID=UPI000BFBC788|nr:oligosaccharide repeat unit polymerase [Bacillus toyonensis]PHC35530.1 oligosaccharide repeat unit polymerase [Bacillus toyonensis]